jgi:hypothetical protein
MLLELMDRHLKCSSMKGPSGLDIEIPKAESHTRRQWGCLNDTLSDGVVNSVSVAHTRL